MILYKYVSLNTAMRIVKNNSIAFTCAEDLNDPFEATAFGFVDGDVSANTAIKAYKNNISRNYAILSLTRQPLNSLMWSHYAESHQGAVVGIDIEASGLALVEKNTIPAQFGEVIYTSRKSGSSVFLPSVEELRSISKDPKFNSSLFNLFKRAFLYKSLEWAYEEEVRVVKTLSDSKFGYHSGEGKFTNSSGNWEKRYVSSLGRPIYNYFLPSGCIKELYFGHKIMMHVDRIKSISIESFRDFKTECTKKDIKLFITEPLLTSWNMSFKEMSKT